MVFNFFTVVFTSSDPRGHIGVNKNHSISLLLSKKPKKTKSLFMSDLMPGVVLGI